MSRDYDMELYRKLTEAELEAEATRIRFPSEEVLSVL